MFVEASAKAGINVKQLFKNLAQNLPGVNNKGTTGNKNESKGDSAAGTQANKFGLKVANGTNAADNDPSQKKSSCC